MISSQHNESGISMDTQSHKTGKHLRNPYLMTRTAIAPVPSTIHEAMVAEAAYYLAERRSFVPGFELQDWLIAEREVDESLARKI